MIFLVALSARLSARSRNRQSRYTECNERHVHTDGRPPVSRVSGRSGHRTALYGTGARIPFASAARCRPLHCRERTRHNGRHLRPTCGGTAITFRSDHLKKPKRTKKRGRVLAKLNRDASLFSEHAVYAAQSRWENASIKPDTRIPATDIARICRRFDEFSFQWSKLPIGGSVTLEWRQKRRTKVR